MASIFFILFSFGLSAQADSHAFRSGSRPPPQLTDRIQPCCLHECFRHIAFSNADAKSQIPVLNPENA
jgi:hypothetical protein